MDKAQAVTADNIALTTERITMALHLYKNILQDTLSGLQNTDSWVYVDMTPPLALANGLVDRLREIEARTMEVGGMIEAIHSLLGIGGMKPAPPMPPGQIQMVRDTQGVGIGGMLGTIGQGLAGQRILR